VRLSLPVLAAAIGFCVLVPAAQAGSTTVRTSQGTITTTRGEDGVRHMKFRWGPIRINPGQNTISLAANALKPSGPGWITSFKPDLTYVDGKVPRVDIIHLHHAVWLAGPANDLRPTWAAGEEKTIFRTPKGLGWRYRSSDKWLLNHMIHNLTPVPTRVFITWEMDFAALGAKAARGMREVRTQWLDVEGLKAYPVFDALQGTVTPGASRTPTTSPTRTPAARRATPGWSTTTPASWAPPATCIRAGCGRTSRSRVTDAPSRSSARARSTSNRPARCRGTSRCPRRRRPGG
jgi:hypothetical protein